MILKHEFDSSTDEDRIYALFCLLKKRSLHVEMMVKQFLLMVIKCAHPFSPRHFDLFIILINTYGRTEETLRSLHRKIPPHPSAPTVFQLTA